MVHIRDRLFKKEEKKRRKIIFEESDEREIFMRQSKTTKKKFFSFTLNIEKYFVTFSFRGGRFEETTNTLSGSSESSDILTDCREAFAICHELERPSVTFDDTDQSWDYRLTAMFFDVLADRNRN